MAYKYSKSASDSQGNAFSHFWHYCFYIAAIQNNFKYISLIDYQTEDSTRQAAEYATKISRIMVRLGMLVFWSDKYGLIELVTISKDYFHLIQFRYDQAADALRREICLNQQTESFQAIGRLAVALVLIQLARGDSVAAEKAFKEWGNCCDANEVQTLEMLLQVRLMINSVLLLFFGSAMLFIQFKELAVYFYKHFGEYVVSNSNKNVFLCFLCVTIPM